MAAFFLLFWTYWLLCCIKRSQIIMLLVSYVLYGYGIGDPLHMNSYGIE